MTYKTPKVIRVCFCLTLIAVYSFPVFNRQPQMHSADGRQLTGLPVNPKHWKKDTAKGQQLPHAHRDGRSSTLKVVMGQHICIS